MKRSSIASAVLFGIFAIIAGNAYAACTYHFSVANQSSSVKKLYKIRNCGETCKRKNISGSNIQISPGETYSGTESIERKANYVVGIAVTTDSGTKYWHSAEDVGSCYQSYQKSESGKPITIVLK